MTPLQRYEQALNAPDVQEDPAQRAAVEALDSVFHELVESESKSPTRRSLFGRKTTQSSFVTGLYMWGGVGRGKTWLMDLFFDCLPLEKKKRTHFHRFMRDVHQRLHQLEGVQNPLDTIADEVAGRARVICFDEFFVSDITDAMILGTLFEALFERGVCLIATSNVVPDELYRDGLQRARFLPAIELIKSRTTVLNVDGGNDYRLRALEQAEIFHHPLDHAAELNLQNSFAAIAPEPGRPNLIINLNNRPFQTCRVADGVLWLSFEQACDGPKSASDYIEIAMQFHTVLLSGVPVLDWESENQARRLISLVDEFYDRNVKLICSAAAPIDQLYCGERLSFEFERTASRLLEMQSRDYLAKPHLP